jgi:23S rRNA pseudouridine1911/1915/1917 synthase
MSLEILLTNQQVLVLNKPPGISVQPDKTGDPTLLGQAEAYCRHPLHVVHRIDRPVSGIVVFAKSLTRQMQARTVERLYLAVVQELPEPECGVLAHYLSKQGGRNRMVVSADGSDGGHPAALSYRLLGSSARYHLLEVGLLTGRHHQIRAQLSAAGFPVKGDVKYGARRGNSDRSVHLHAWKVAFDHPVTGSRVRVEAALPESDPVWRAMSALI